MSDSVSFSLLLLAALCDQSSFFSLLFLSFFFFSLISCFEAIKKCETPNTTPRTRHDAAFGCVCVVVSSLRARTFCSNCVSHSQSGAEQIDDWWSIIIHVRMHTQTQRVFISSVLSVLLLIYIFFLLLFLSSFFVLFFFFIVSFNDNRLICREAHNRCENEIKEK